MISLYLEKALLKKILQNRDFAVREVYLSLHTADPERAGRSEMSGYEYKRQKVAFSDQFANNHELEFRVLPPSVVTHVGLWDAAEDGNFLWGEALSEKQDLGPGWSFRIRQQQISGMTIR